MIFGRIRESLLPQKFPAIQYIVNHQYSVPFQQYHKEIAMLFVEGLRIHVKTTVTIIIENEHPVP